MRIALGSTAWKRFLLDSQPHKAKLVRAAFYLGFGAIEIENLVRRLPDDPEVDNVIQTAEFLGMADEDTVYFDPSITP